MEKPNKTTLITVLGSSPQVMTETFYGLKDKGFPERIIVFTTLHGANEMNRLNVTEKIRELCQHYALPQPTLLTEDIIIVKDLQGKQLNDIRNNEDQEAIADQITETVRNLVKDADTAIHASIAGGRKSMSFYMGYIFSIFARPCDTLSHVLVAPEYESSNFWFPTKNSSPFVVCKDRETGTEIVLDAKNAQVELAEIPFLRINNSLVNQGDLLTQNATYRETLNAYQLSLSPENICLEFVQDNNILLNGIRLDLPLETIVFYRLIAQSTQNKLKFKNENLDDEFEGEFLSELAKIAKVNLNGNPAYDQLDKVESEINDHPDTYISPKFFKSIKDNYLTTTITERLKKEIKIALKKVAIGKVITLCEVTIVKEDLDESKPEARSRTKGGYLGLQLNPKQIYFS